MRFFDMAVEVLRLDHEVETSALLWLIEPEEKAPDTGVIVGPVAGGALFLNGGRF